LFLFMKGGIFFSTMVEIFAKNFQESLKLLDRYQTSAMTASLAFFLLTWTWPWAGENLVNPPVPLPPTEKIPIEFIPIEVSISLAIAIFFLVYLGTSLRAAFLANSVRQIANKLHREDPEQFTAHLTFPSPTTHSARIFRLQYALIIILLIYFSMVREFWWEHNEPISAFINGAILTLIATLPQISIIYTLWQPLKKISTPE